MTRLNFNLNFSFGSKTLVNNAKNISSERKLDKTEKLSKNSIPSSPFSFRPAPIFNNSVNAPKSNMNAVSIEKK